MELEECEGCGLLGWPAQVVSTAGSAWRCPALAVVCRSPLAYLHLPLQPVNSRWVRPALLTVPWVGALPTGVPELLQGFGQG